MSVRVITPPEPIVVPADIFGSHAANDPKVTAVIAAATEEIDGPTGWLGRSLGKQTLELILPHFEWCGISLPFVPIVDVLSIKYLDRDGVEQTMPEGQYRLSQSASYAALNPVLGKSWPSTGRFDDAVRVRYEAGYDEEAVEAGGTGPVPIRAKQAIILATQNLLTIGAENLFLRSETVEGVGERQYTVSDASRALIAKTQESLLNGLRIYG